MFIRDAALGVPLGVGREVAEVADVALGVGWGAVVFAEGIDWWKGEKCQLFSILLLEWIVGLFGVSRWGTGERERERREGAKSNIQCGPALVHPFVLSPN